MLCRLNVPTEQVSPDCLLEFVFSKFRYKCEHEVFNLDYILSHTKTGLTKVTPYQVWTMSHAFLHQPFHLMQHLTQAFARFLK